MSDEILTADFKPAPFWWDDAAPFPARADVPRRCDVAVIGSGYCGLSAALTLARNSVDVVVLEAEDPGFGASSRNSGHVCGPPKLPIDLAGQVGARRANWIREDYAESNRFFLDLIRSNVLSVDFQPHGRFIAAHTPKAYAALQRKAEHYRGFFDLAVTEVPRARQRNEIGSDYYYGGIVIEAAGSLHPGKLHREIRRLAEEAGASICGNAPVLRIDRRVAGFVLTTPRGEIDARQVIVATNAYAGPAIPFLRRRVIPVVPFMAATEPLPRELVQEILPSNRNGGDTKRLLYAFRRSPDGRRLIFTGRAGSNGLDERRAAQILHGQILGVWPQLRGVRLSHSWKGFVGFTFDLMPHIGTNDGLLYAAGCQGAGVVIMTYFGHRLALKALGQEQRPCGYESNRFPGMLGYSGTPWFLSFVEAIYRMRDTMERRFAN